VLRFRGLQQSSTRRVNEKKKDNVSTISVRRVEHRHLLRTYTGTSVANGPIGGYTIICVFGERDIIYIIYYNVERERERDGERVKAGDGKAIVNNNSL